MIIAGVAMKSRTSCGWLPYRGAIQRGDTERRYERAYLVCPFSSPVSSSLVEGCSNRSTVRITGVTKDTIQKLPRGWGEACLKFQDKMLRNLTCKRVRCDELGCFCYGKHKNLPDRMRGKPGVGSIWTWTALCADSKLMLSWRLGALDAASAHMFMSEVAYRLANRAQLTTEGNNTYLDAVRSEDRRWLHWGQT